LHRGITGTLPCAGVSVSSGSRLSAGGQPGADSDQDQPGDGADGKPLSEQSDAQNQGHDRHHVGDHRGGGRPCFVDEQVEQPVRDTGVDNPERRQGNEAARRGYLPGQVNGRGGRKARPETTVISAVIASAAWSANQRRYSRERVLK
jgi:hypothetical protein